MSCIVTKWRQTGLLEGLESLPAQAKMAELLERESTYLLDIAATLGPFPPPGKTHNPAVMLFPIVRRAFSQIDYEVIDADPLPIDLDVSYDPRTLDDLSAYHGLDVEVEIATMVSDAIVSKLKGMKVKVGSIPLEFEKRDGRLHFLTRSVVIISGGLESPVNEVPGESTKG